MDLSSSAFVLGGLLPRRHTADGEDLSPPLTWSDPPVSTHCFALIVDDPDAPRRVWTHWLAWNLRGDHLPEGVSGLTEGTNDFGRRGWGGPSPPPGSGAHRYRFTLYALDRPLHLPAGATRAELEEKLRGRVLGITTLTARYYRDRG